MKQDDFGVIVVCSDNDLLFAKGCLESVRYFMPDTSVCLLIDGNKDVTDLKREFNLQVIRRKDIKDPFLKENSFGFGITKMITFWESPFEKFLVLDADICVWGDLRKIVSFGDFDMIIDQPQYTFSEEDVIKWFFDIEMLKTIDHEFVPLRYNDRYFCTGVFFAKKGIFDLSWYKELLAITKSKLDIFKYGEMGLLNYMIFKQVDSSKLKVQNIYIQHICPDFTKEQSKSIFNFDDKSLPVVNRAQVIHFNGNRKPIQTNDLCYHRPMTFFRNLYYTKQLPHATPQQINKWLLKEDAQFVNGRMSLKDKLKNIVRPVLKPLFLSLKLR